MRAALRAPLRGEVLHVENDGFHVRHLAHLLQHPRVKFLPAADAIASSRRAREYSRLGEGTELRLERREGPLCPAVYNTSSLTALPAPPRSTPTLLPSFVCLCCFHCSHPSSPTLCRGYRRGNAPRSIARRVCAAHFENPSSRNRQCFNWYRRVQITSRPTPAAILCLQNLL